MLRFKDHKTRALPSVADYNLLFNDMSTPAVNATITPTGSVKSMHFTFLFKNSCPECAGRLQLLTFLLLSLVSLVLSLHACSCPDFWKKASYGTLDIQSVFSGWIDISLNEADVGKGAVSALARQQTSIAIAEALNFLAAKGATANLNALGTPAKTWADFDSDKDGQIDAITVIHSGYAAENGNNGGVDFYKTPKANRVWSHKASLGGIPAGTPNWNNQVWSFANVAVSPYNIENGLAGTGVSSTSSTCMYLAVYFSCTLCLD